MNVEKLLALASSALLFAACSGRVLDTNSGSGSGASKGSDGGASSGGEASSSRCASVARPPACSQNPTGQVVTATLDVFSAAVSQRWLLCGNQSVFGPSGGGGDDGLEITPDGHWYKLFPAVGGGTVRGAGFGQEGTWTALSVPQTPTDSQPFQLNLQDLGGGTLITHPVLASTPPAMRLDNEGVYVGDYVLDESVPVGSVRCGP